MKIMLVPGAYFPALGGTERTTRMVAETLANRGHSVSVVVADIRSFSGFYNLTEPRTGRPISENINGVDIFRVELYSSWMSSRASMAGRIKPHALGSLTMKALKYISRRKFHDQLKTIVNRLQPDIILALPHLQPNVRIAADIAKSKGLLFGLFPHIHSHDPYFPHKKLSSICRSADICIGITEEECSILLNKYKVKVENIIYSGLGTTVHNDDNAKPNREKSNDILFVGRKTASKGLLLLAKAIESVIGTANFRVVLIGARAADTDCLEAEFKKRLTNSEFISEDNVSDADLISWYKKSKIVVLPSRMESFGSVILEAWAHKKAIVTLDLPIFREIIDDNVDGMLVPADDVDALSKTISKLLNDELKSDRMGQAGYEKLLKKYTWDSVIDRIERKLNEVYVTKKARLAKLDGSFSAPEHEG